MRMGPEMLMLVDAPRCATSVDDFLRRNILVNCGNVQEGELGMLALRLLYAEKSSTRQIRIPLSFFSLQAEAGNENGGRNAN